MISVLLGTDDILDGMISALQMIYASRMLERILYHACAASISCGVSRISRRVSDISLRNLPGCESIRPKSKSIFFVPACQKRPPLSGVVRKTAK